MSRLKVSRDAITGAPRAVDPGSGWVAVEQVVERWRATTGWWRKPPLSFRDLEYWRILLQDGSCWELQLDLSNQRWALIRRWG